jgi:multiple sugar transport system ATP-binding protein
VATISLKGVTKQFRDGTAAVRALTSDIANGELIVFTGPSGSGKTTALNMIVGLEDISEGELRIDDKVVNQLALKDRDVAMVFQSSSLYSHMTVRQNMSFALRLAHTPSDEIDRRVNEAAEMLELTDHLDRKPSNLPEGQCQRVAMGRAMVRKPEDFLMDEPLSTIDATLRVQLRTLISRLQRRLNVTTVYATHDQTDAMMIGDRIMVLRFGQMQQLGTPRQLYELPVNLFVAAFIGSPAMNFMPGRLEGDALMSPLGEVQLPAQRLQRLAGDGGGRDVVVGIRPENFEDAALLENAKRDRGRVVTLKAEVLESAGSHVYAHFPLPWPDKGQMVKVEQVAQEVATADASGWAEQLVAKLGPNTTAREGAPIDLWFDMHKLYLFDPLTGLAFGR